MVATKPNKMGEFWSLPKVIAQAPYLSFGAKCVYGVLWTRRNGENTAWPSQKTIAEYLGIKERQVRNLIEELKTLDVVVVETRQTGLKKHNEYHLTDRHYLASHTVQDQQTIAGEDQQAIAVQESISEENNNTPASRKGESRLVIEKYKELYAEKISKRAPVFVHGQCHALAKKWVAEFGLGRVLELLYYYLDSDEPFWERRGWSLSLFLSANTIHALHAQNGPIITPKRRA